MNKGVKITGGIYLLVLGALFIIGGIIAAFDKVEVSPGVTKSLISLETPLFLLVFGLGILFTAPGLFLVLTKRILHPISFLLSIFAALVFGFTAIIDLFSGSTEGISLTTTLAIAVAPIYLVGIVSLILSSKAPPKQRVDDTGKPAEPTPVFQDITKPKEEKKKVLKLVEGEDIPVQSLKN